MKGRTKSILFGSHVNMATLIDLHPVDINEAAEAHGTRALTDPNDP